MNHELKDAILTGNCAGTKVKPDRVTNTSLYQALKIVKPIISQKTALPVLRCVLCDSGEIVAADLEVRCHIYGNFGFPNVVVPFNDLYKAASISPELQIEVIDTKTALIKGKNYQARVESYEPEDFPPLPKDKVQHMFEIESSTLLNAINQVAFCAARDDDRQVLNGISLIHDGYCLSLAGANGFLLGHTKLALPSNPFKCIVTPRAFSMLSNSGKASVKLGQHLWLHQTDRCIVTSLIEGTFPDYSPLIPPQESFVASAIIREWGKVIAIIPKFVSVRIQLSDGRTWLTVVTDDTRQEINAPGESTGEAKTALAIGYLKDAVKHADRILLQASPERPVMFLNSNDPEYRHVVMPMYVQWEGVLLQDVKEDNSDKETGGQTQPDDVKTEVI